MNAAGDRAAIAEPICPRCGYDLSGACASWSGSCPLHGICAECGLDFRWRDILHPNHAVPSWFFEHATMNRAGAFFRTVRRSFTPWTFWRQVRLHYGVRTFRLCTVALAALLVAHLIIGGSSLLMMERIQKVFGRGGLFGFAPLLPPGLPDSAYAAAYAAWPYSTLGAVDGATAGDSPWLVLAFGCFLFTPAAFLVLPTTLQRCRVRGAHLFRVACYSLVGLPLITLVACVLQTFAPPWQWFRGLATDPYSQAFLGHFGSLPILGIAWLAVFWWFAATRYLKLPHAAGVVATMIVLAFLLSAVPVAFLHPGFQHNPVTQMLFW